ncbi:MAG: helix-turn-helix transcriptional regulator [Candidatus Bilamarchaeaceae archaeon]
MGQIFDGDTNKPLNDTLISVSDSSAKVVFQKLFDSPYSLSLQPGEYEVFAGHYVNGTLISFCRHKVRVSSIPMELDLLLIPYDIQSLVPDASLPSRNIADILKAPAKGIGIPEEYLILAFAVFIAVIILVAYTLLNKRNAASSPMQPEPQGPRVLDVDCAKVMKIIQENEGRMVQKEIREILNFSETKMSLIVAELEASGLIKRIKKGRENILKLVK